MPRSRTSLFRAGTGLLIISTLPPIEYDFNDAAIHDVIVPAGYTTATFECWGSKGETRSTQPGGSGQYIKATITGLTPGESLRLTPGGLPSGGAAGFNGGGSGGNAGAGIGGGGGGASDIRRGGVNLANRILVGGGGGGSSPNGPGTASAGGVGGSPSGGNGGGCAATGGSQVSGGSTGGVLGVGGSAANSPAGGRGGGGGGGGYYGGGAGATGFGINCAGGGGSGFCDPSLVLVTAEATGTWAATGRVRVIFE